MVTVSSYPDCLALYAAHVSEAAEIQHEAVKALRGGRRTNVFARRSGETTLMFSACKTMDGYKVVEPMPWSARVFASERDAVAAGVRSIGRFLS